MIHISKSPISPRVFSSPKTVKAKQELFEFYSRDAASRGQERYSEKYIQQIRQDFLPTLRTEFNGKCAYCESKIHQATTHSEYDHFRPKKSARGMEGESSQDHYWWLMYEWSNIYYVCTKCNTYKSTWFPVEGNRGSILSSMEDLYRFERNMLVDPCSSDPDEHFRYDESGEIIDLTREGLITIDLLKLNRIELVEERRLAFEQAVASFDQFEAILQYMPTDVPRLNVFLAAWRDIFSDNCTLPYLGIRRYFIYEWLKQYELHDYLVNRNFFMTTDEQLSKMLDGVEGKVEEIKFDFKTAASNDYEVVQKKLEDLRHTFIEKMELHNFRCFEDLTLHFGKGDPSYETVPFEGQSYEEPWVLLLGENAVGKSSILKALAIGLSGREYIKSLELKGSDLLRTGTDSGYIKLYMVGNLAPSHITFTESELTCNMEQPILNFVAYNAIRLKYTPPHILPEVNNIRSVKAKNLFDFTASLVDCDRWLVKLDPKRFDKVALTLKDLMGLGNDDLIFMENGRAIVKKGIEYLPVDQLSDGYQSIFNMTIDIMATIEIEGIPFEVAEGMIIIDEIGAHLHPRWRMQVIGKLRRAFPKMRFVVSTHEPLCLRGVQAGETIVLRRDEEQKIEAITDLPNPAELRIDQILTSDFFGLSSTMDPETEAQFNEYYHLLSKDEDELSWEDSERLDALKILIPKIRNLGQTTRESIIYQVVDRLLAERKTRNPFRSIDEIKQQAFDRLKGIWDIETPENL